MFSGKVKEYRMNDKQVSDALELLNKERILYQSLYDENVSKHNRIRNIICQAVHGNWGYVMDKCRLHAKAGQERSHRKTDGKAGGCIPRDVPEDKKLIIYTVMFGNYDLIAEPLFITRGCTYYIFTDSVLPEQSVWKKYPLDGYSHMMKGFSSLERARFIKTHPHIFFPDAEYSIFIDANVQIVADMRPVFSRLGESFIAIHKQPGRDCIYQEARAVIALRKAPAKEVKHQIRKYRMQKFPEHYGLFQTNIIVREHHNPACRKLMALWWNEMEK